MQDATERSGPDDAELVRQVRNGSPSAFGMLVERHQDRVFNAVYRMCNNHADAQDLTQTAFLKALQGLPRFAQQSGFGTWLFRIAMNEALSHRRARLRRRTVGLGAEADGVAQHDPAASPTANPAAAVEREEQRERLAAALHGLDPEFRAAVVLKDVEGFDYATISEILSIPVGTVKSRIFRGRSMLRSALCPAGGGPATREAAGDA